MAPSEVVSRRRVFVDTSGIIASVSTDDAHHNHAVYLRSELQKRGAQFLTLDSILTEVANTFSRARDRRVAVGAINSIRESAGRGEFRIIHASVDLFDEAWLLYQSRSDKDWSLTDCMCFEFMRKERIKEAFTTDHHFEQAGFVRLLRP